MNFPSFDLYWADLEAMLDERAERVRTEGADPFLMARDLIDALPDLHHVKALTMIAIECRRHVIGVTSLPEEAKHAGGVAALSQTTPVLREIQQQGMEAEALLQLASIEIARRAK